MNAKIHTIKVVPSGILAALIFTPDTPGNFRNYVRTYICEELQKKMTANLIKLQLDDTDYTIEVPLAVDSDEEQKKAGNPAKEDSGENKNQEPKTPEETE